MHDSNDSGCKVSSCRFLHSCSFRGTTPTEPAAHITPPSTVLTMQIPLNTDLFQPPVCRFGSGSPSRVSLPLAFQVLTSSPIHLNLQFAFPKPIRWQFQAKEVYNRCVICQFTRPPFPISTHQPYRHHHQDIPEDDTSFPTAPSHQAPIVSSSV